MNNLQLTNYFKDEIIPHNILINTLFKSNILERLDQFVQTLYQFKQISNKINFSTKMLLSRSNPKNHPYNNYDEITPKSICLISNSIILIRIDNGDKYIFKDYKLIYVVNYSDYLDNTHFETSNLYYELEYKHINSYIIFSDDICLLLNTNRIKLLEDLNFMLLKYFERSKYINYNLPELIIAETFKRNKLSKIHAISKKYLNDGRKLLKRMNLDFNIRLKAMEKFCGLTTIYFDLKDIEEILDEITSEKSFRWHSVKDRIRCIIKILHTSNEYIEALIHHDGLDKFSAILFLSVKNQMLMSDNYQTSNIQYLSDVFTKYEPLPDENYENPAKYFEYLLSTKYISREEYINKISSCFTGTTDIEIYFLLYFAINTSICLNDDILLKIHNLGSFHTTSIRYDYMSVILRFTIIFDIIKDRDLMLADTLRDFLLLNSRDGDSLCTINVLICKFYISKNISVRLEDIVIFINKYLNYSNVSFFGYILVSMCEFSMIAKELDMNKMGLNDITTFVLILGYLNNYFKAINEALEDMDDKRLLSKLNINCFSFVMDRLDEILAVDNPDVTMNNVEIYHMISEI